MGFSGPLQPAGFIWICVKNFLLWSKCSERTGEREWIWRSTEGRSNPVHPRTRIWESGLSFLRTNLLGGVGEEDYGMEALAHKDWRKLLDKQEWIWSMSIWLESTRKYIPISWMSQNHVQSERSPGLIFSKKCTNPFAFFQWKVACREYVKLFSRRCPKKIEIFG